jgi:hypothetical protein
MFFIWGCLIDGILFFWAFRHHNLAH